MTVQTQFIAELTNTYTGILNAMSVYTYPTAFHTVTPPNYMQVAPIGHMDNIRYSPHRDDTHSDLLGFHVTHLSWPSSRLVAPLFKEDHPLSDTPFVTTFRAAQREIDIASGRLQEMLQQEKSDGEIVSVARALMEKGDTSEGWKAPGNWIRSAIMLSGIQKPTEAEISLFDEEFKKFLFGRYKNANYILPLIIQLKPKAMKRWGVQIKEIDERLQALSWCTMLKKNDEEDPRANELILYAGLGYCLKKGYYAGISDGLRKEYFETAAELWEISGDRKDAPEDLLRAAWARLTAATFGDADLESSAALMLRAAGYLDQSRKDELEAIARQLDEGFSSPA